MTNDNLDNPSVPKSVSFEKFLAKKLHVSKIIRNFAELKIKGGHDTTVPPPSVTS